MAVLTSTHNLCFEQKYEKKNQENLTEDCHLYSREKLQCIAWACFRNVMNDMEAMSHIR